MSISPGTWQRVLRSSNQIVVVENSLFFHSRKSGRQSRLGPPLVFLPGWGFDGRIMGLAKFPEGWISPSVQLNPATLLADLVEYLDQEKIERIGLVGWSMGANLAFDFAKRYPERLAVLYLLSMRNVWPIAELDQIRQDLAGGGSSFMQAFYRKCFAGYKEEYKIFQDRFERRYLAEMNADLLARGLDYLQTSNPAGPLAAGLEVHIIHGGRDIIAPVSQMFTMAGARVKVVKRGGHPIFIDHNFSTGVNQRKEVIRRKFSRAAATYDQSAKIQKKLTAELITRMPENFAPKTILEIGCGTGNYTVQLADKYSGAQIMALDFSEEMIALAKDKISEPQRITLRCQDAEDFLRRDKGRFELITANATMQWFDDLEASFHGVSRLLGPGGMFVGSVFGPQTLFELGLGMKEIFGDDFCLPSSSFLDMDQFREILAKDFIDIEIDQWSTVRQYDSLFALLRQIKKTGTAGWQSVTPVFSRSRLARLEKWFVREFGGCRTTYQVYFIRCGVTIQQHSI
ncbi:MAG: alpha/beta fold hydrolase [Proteobacteria bacterium]|nr:alpha/beta fold hydrolase [Pseudomonadota bacterium]MBU1714002.1 alpha/beta fold hydrolase [Pseudomonadota bacterium]